MELGPSSAIQFKKYESSSGGSLYHLCNEVGEIDVALAEAERQGVHLRLLPGAGCCLGQRRLSFVLYQAWSSSWNEVEMCER